MLIVSDVVERAAYILNQEAKRRWSGSFLMFWCPPSSNSLGIKPLTHEYMGDTQTVGLYHWPQKLMTISQ